MKKAMLSAKMNIPDDFTSGDCTRCPIVVKKFTEIAYGNSKEEYVCPLKCSPNFCPIEVETDLLEEHKNTPLYLKGQLRKDVENIIRCLDDLDYNNQCLTNIIEQQKTELKSPEKKKW